jgi:hypothetical protein
VEYPGEKHGVNCLHVNFWRISDSGYLYLYFTHCLRQNSAVKTWPCISHIFKDSRLFKYWIHWLLIVKKTWHFWQKSARRFNPCAELSLMHCDGEILGDNKECFITTDTRD